MNAEAAAHHLSEGRRRRRRAARFGLAGAGAVAVTVIAVITVFNGIGPRSQVNPFALIPLIPLTIIVVLFLVLAAYNETLATRHATAGILASRGLEAIANIQKSDRPQLFAPFAHLTFLRHGAKGLRFWAGGDIDATRMDLIVHHYVVHTGKTAHTVRHTVAATPCSPAWPSVSLSPRNFITGWWAGVRGHNLRLESDSFNERWIIKTDNEDFALLLLSPEVQAFLAQGPSGESWQVGSSQICWFARKSVKPANVAIPVDRLTGLMALVPPELTHWSAGA